MAAVPFPILRLPESALQKSVQLFDVVEKLSLSILSKNTKQLITSLNKEPTKSHVSLTSSCISLRLQNELYDDFKFILDSDQSVVIRDYTNTSESKLNVPGFTEHQWFEHITDVFFRNECKSLATMGSRSIKKFWQYIKGLKILELQVEYSQIQNFELHKRFPLVKKLTVYSEDPIPKSILTPSIEGLKLHRMNLTVDDLLALNHYDFSASTQSFSTNDVNIFLKDWIKGSNPNLKHFNLYRSNVQQEFDEDIFKGIEGVKIKKRGFKGYGPSKRKFEIKRHDGTKALVDVDKSYLYLSMIVN